MCPHLRKITINIIQILELPKRVCSSRRGKGFCLSHPPVPSHLPWSLAGRRCSAHDVSVKWREEVPVCVCVWGGNGTSEPRKHEVDASWLLAKRMDEQLHRHVQGRWEHERRQERGSSAPFPPRPHRKQQDAAAWPGLNLDTLQSSSRLGVPGPIGLFPTPWASLLSLPLTLRKGLGLCPDCPPRGGQRERLSGESLHRAHPREVDASMRGFSTVTDRYTCHSQCKGSHHLNSNPVPLASPLLPAPSPSPDSHCWIFYFYNSPVTNVHANGIYRPFLYPSSSEFFSFPPPACLPRTWT